MQGNMDTKPDFQLQDRISRIAEGVLMLAAALTGLWLLGVLALSFLK